jgi:hypothetical protein
MTSALLSMALAAALGSDSVSPAAPPVHAISEIKLEHNCFGCPTGSILVLQRSGTATYTVTGSARHGTVDRASTGPLRREDFDALAQLLVSRGFFALEDKYDDPQARDGAWTTVSAVRGGQEKKVFHRVQAGPARLRAIEQAIEAVKARLVLAPSISSIP